MPITLSQSFQCSASPTLIGANEDLGTTIILLSSTPAAIALCITADNSRSLKFRGSNKKSTSGEALLLFTNFASSRVALNDSARNAFTSTLRPDRVVNSNPGSCLWPGKPRAMIRSIKPDCSAASPVRTSSTDFLLTFLLAGSKASFLNVSSESSVKHSLWTQTPDVPTK